MFSLQLFAVNHEMQPPITSRLELVDSDFFSAVIDTSVPAEKKTYETKTVPL